MEASHNECNVGNNDLSASGLQRTSSLPAHRVTKATNLMRGKNGGSIRIIVSPNKKTRSAQNDMQNQHQGDHKNIYHPRFPLKCIL